MSCGGNNNKTCNAKSCQRYYNNNAQAFAAGQTLTLAVAGNRVVDSGISIETVPQGFNTLKRGLYHIVGDIVIDPTTAGDVTFAVYMDGVQLPCTLKAVTLVDATNVSVHTETDLELSGCCCDVSHAFTFVLASTTGAGSVIQSCFGCLKLA